MPIPTPVFTAAPAAARPAAYEDLPLFALDTDGPTTTTATVPTPTHEDLFALDGPELTAVLDSLTSAQREQLAGPWPARWLYPPRPDDPPRGLNVCAGCGGGCAGLRLVLGVQADTVCVELKKDPTATSTAAGCTVIQRDIKTLDPRHPALLWTRRVMCTMPCIDWTRAGLGAGRDAENLAILLEAIDQVAAHMGNVWVDGSELCTHDDPADCDEDVCYDHMIEPSGAPITELWSLVDDMTAATAGLMLAPVIWILGLRSIGAPIETIVIEQSSALPETVQEYIWTELTTAGCESVQWQNLDAADFGSASNRNRAIMSAHWYRNPGPVTAPRIGTGAAHALGWPPQTRINTRGERRTSGGNVFALNRTIPAVTSKIRGWYCQDTGRRFTIPEVCALVGLPGTYPVTGSRTSQCQQLGDIFSPLVAAAVWGTLLGLPWLDMLRTYLAQIHPTVHARPDPAAILFNPDRTHLTPAVTDADIARLFASGDYPRFRIQLQPATP
ncbi:hypothetical protein PUR61_38585 [Streptomyces sp. BE20]|uniref:hypothetical protein n=1 Tax=Streptomyces sp. BE20 TaxID=3002525 RepID=UPI002E76A48D|nr:hypothetical protein [Streptomyces sp. BE20]MEE1828044.1 hypothetical protein [Streptomyces sp. BE20]